MDSSDNCAICMEALGDDGVPLNCGHLYHGKCVVPWLQKGGGCPTCRDKPHEPRQEARDTSLTRVRRVRQQMLEVLDRTAELEQRGVQVRRTPTMNGFKAFGYVKRPVVKERIDCQNRLDQLRHEEDPTLAPAPPIGDRTARLQNVNHMVRTELAERWTAMPETVKTQWGELAVEATARGQATADGLRLLLASHPHMMPGMSN